MSVNSITLIGGGNLGKAIAEGLIASKFVKPNNYYQKEHRKLRLLKKTRRKNFFRK
jgi:pyrroline-5-carboxylate reductase